MEGGGGVDKGQWREGEVLIRDSGGRGGVDKGQWREVEVLIRDSGGRGRC